MPLISLLLFAIACQTQAKVSSIVVFGDSTVDAGNNNYVRTILKSNFEPYGRDFPGRIPTGRFSNGRIPTDFISEAFGLGSIVPAYLDPSYNISTFATKVCFASAGTGYDTATSDVMNVIPLREEVEYYKEYQKRLKEYLGESRANETVAEALYITSLGTNDFLENYYLLPGRRLQFGVDEYQGFLIGIAEHFVKELYGLGGRKMLITGLSPIGCVPLERTLNDGNCNELYNRVAWDFNSMLIHSVRRLNRELPGIRLVYSCPYNILMNVLQNPSPYGFEVTSKACCGSGMFEMGFICRHDNPLTCIDANKYVFWDAFHPTEKMNLILANDAIRNALTQFL